MNGGRPRTPIGTHGSINTHHPLAAIANSDLP